MVLLSFPKIDCIAFGMLWGKFFQTSAMQSSRALAQATTKIYVCTDAELIKFMSFPFQLWVSCLS